MNFVRLQMLKRVKIFKNKKNKIDLFKKWFRVEIPVSSHLYFSFTR